MELKDIEVLIECKRLVETMLREKKYILKQLDGTGKDVRCVQRDINRMERALEGMPPMRYCDAIEGR